MREKLSARLPSGKWRMRTRNDTRMGVAVRMWGGCVMKVRGGCFYLFFSGEK